MRALMSAVLPSHSHVSPRFGCSILVATLLAAGPASAAPSWSRTYEGLVGPARLARRADGGFYLAASSNRPSDGAHPMVLLALDASGAVEWSDQVTLESADVYPAQVVVDPDGTLVVVGEQGAGTAARGFVHRRDGTAWNRTYLHRSQLSAALRSADGTFVVAGWYDGSDTTTGFRIPVLSRIAGDGSIAWEKTDGAIGLHVGTLRLAETASGELYEAGMDLTGAPPGLIVGKHGSDGSTLWHRFYSADNGILPWSIAAPADGDVVVTGAGTRAWVIQVASDSSVGWKKQYTAGVTGGDRFESIVGSADGGYLVAGSTEGLARALVAKLDASGALLWQKVLADFSAASQVLETPDGDAVIAGTVAAAGTSLFVARLDRGLDTTGLCAVRDGTLVAADVPVNTLDIPSIPPEDERWLAPGARATGAASVTALNPCAGCVVPPSVVTLLRGVRRGDDAEFSWQRDPTANAYNLWYVGDKRDIDRARAASSPPAVAVVGCAIPDAASAPPCTDAGAVPRVPSLLFYQVRAFCDAANEGP